MPTRQQSWSVIANLKPCRRKGRNRAVNKQFNKQPERLHDSCKEPFIAASGRRDSVESQAPEPSGR